MHVATLMLSKPIHWVIAASDPQLIPLRNRPGWSVVHPLTPSEFWPDEYRGRYTFPTGDGRLFVDCAILRCVIPDDEAQHGARNEKVLAELAQLLSELRHISRQATLPRGEQRSIYSIPDYDDLPPVEFGEPYYGEVYFHDFRIDTALTVEMVSRAGELPPKFEPPIYEGVLLDAFKAVIESDFRTALLYAALAIEVVAGTILDQQHKAQLSACPIPPHIRAIRSEAGDSAGELEDPVYKHLRKNGRFENLLHELPLYVMQKSLKLEHPSVFEQARKAYQTRNSLAHLGEPRKDRELFTADLYGVVDAQERDCGVCVVRNHRKMVDPLRARCG
ncbi:MAG: hypothetical protein L0241_23890 [Planctomycetia bacterium]|nr:hypothetical protein [Planctomycetia bacterium]